jgi:hypothetical protein
VIEGGAGCRRTVHGTPKQPAMGPAERFMEIKDEHKKILLDMGLKQEDFKLFDGKTVSYEYDEEMGVRLYDPDYMTTYPEYIDVDGWSSWSSEQVVFEKNIIPPARAEANRRAGESPKPTQEELADAMKKKFGK